MEIFLDSADLTEIGKWMRRGVIDGVTTNPSILLKDGVRDIEGEVKKIADLMGNKPVSVEVTTNDIDEMIEEARRLAQWAPNIVVKIPVVNENGFPCLEAISVLRQEGIKINTTAILSFNQIMLAAKAGAVYLSIFAGRVGDEGNDAAALIRTASAWTEKWGYGKILVGSIRGVYDVQTAAAAGAHVITIPPATLDKMADHKYSRETIRVFNEDARKALAALKVIAAR